MTRYATDLRHRARLFAVAVYRLSKHARERYPALRNGCDQLFDAASSIGANLAESEALNTRKELAARYSIALKESREARYWLEVLQAAEPTLETPAEPLIRECNEFIAMMTTALKKLRS